MPNDNQPAKSYIEAVLARADGATPLPDTGHSQACGCEECSACWQRGAKFQAEALPLVTKDIKALAKIALRAIEALENVLYDFDPDVAKGPPCGPEMAKKLQAALADINALAAKGSQ